MTSNDHHPTVEVSEPSKTSLRIEATGTARRQSSTPRQFTDTCCLDGTRLTLREATSRLRSRYEDTVSQLQIGLLAVAWLDNQPLWAGTNSRDQLILEWATQLVAQEGAEARAALAAARAVARDRHLASLLPSASRSAAHLSLDEAVRIPELYAALRLDQLVAPDNVPVANPAFTRLEQHSVGSHAIEVWGLSPQPTKPPSPSGCPTGELIGTCIRCGAGVGDDEWTFAAWDGKDWRFSGRTLPEAQRLAALRPLLCSGCAVRAKYKLIPAPEVESKASSSLLRTDQRRDRDVGGPSVEAPPSSGSHHDHKEMT